MRFRARHRRAEGGSGRGSGLRWQVVFLVTAGALTAACEEPVGPELERGVRTASAPSSLAARSPFQSNAVRYRSSGGGAVTGRAGGAALSAWALVDAAGRADLTLVADTASLGNPLPESGAVLGLVQIKAYGADGGLRFTRNDAPGPNRPSANYVLGGLSAGDRVQVQANVAGADRTRTGVVTVTAPVLRRPQLRVESVATPIRAAARTAVNISAVVRETLGDLGARANCVLLVDGQEVDRGWHVWIDAGGAATCVFMHFFPDVGTYHLEVRVADVEPRMFAPGTSSATASISVIHVPSAFSYSASFEDRTFDESWMSRARGRSVDGAWGQEHESENSSRGRTQYSSVWAWMPRAVTFPLAELFVQQYTRDEVAHAARYTDLEPSWMWDDGYMSEACTAREVEGPRGRAWFYLCSRTYGGGADGGSTDFSYARYAGQVTYQSRGYSRFWHRDLGIDDVWSWNDEFDDDAGRLVSYGREYGFAARVDDGAGVYSMNPLVWLEPFEHVSHQPLTCWEWSDEWMAEEGCYSSTYTESGMRGVVWGEPTY